MYAAILSGVMISTPDSLHAVCSYTAQGEAEAEEDGYYRMSYTVRDSAVVVASSGWGGGGTDLVSGTMLSVRRDTGALAVRPLDTDDVGVHPVPA